MKYDALFTPFKIRNMEVKNRIVMSPMGTGSSHIDGTIADDEINYFEERAKGGAGMIIMGCQFLNPDLAQGSLEGVLKENYVIPQLTSLVEALHRYNCKAVCQISCGTGRNAFPNMYGEPPYSSSDTPSTFDPTKKCRPLSKEQIKSIMDEFANSATIAKNAGFDAIEIHGHAGYLINQFMSSDWNKRTDEYGGSMENRMRFPTEIIQSIRGAVGDMPILFRISLDHRYEGGRTLEESVQMIEYLEKAGADALDIDAGCYETIDYIFPTAYLKDACMEYVCEEARKHVSIPLLNTGNHTPETAVELIESGKADFAMFGRQLIADPEMPNKLMEDAVEDVRPCIRCNEECVGRIVGRLTKMSCAVNPRVCDEKRFTIEKTSSPKNVVIIGGGIAGMEAARVAALEGHQVSLYEKSDKLGGQVQAAATPAFKNRLKDLLGWYKTQLKKLPVDIHMNTEVKENDDILKNADRIIVACGALPVVPAIEGMDRENVISVINAHMDKEKVKGQNIVICGGGLSGCDSAIELADEYGKNVTIVEMMDAVAKDVMFINSVSIYNEIARLKINVKTGSKVCTIDEEGVVVEKADGSREVIPADTVITAFGMRPNTELSEKIKKLYPKKTRVIGDNEKVGKVATAVRGGFYAALSL